MTPVETKQAIARHFADHHGQTIYPSDLEALFHLDYDLILGVAQELERDGVIRKAE